MLLNREIFEWSPSQNSTFVRSCQGIFAPVLPVTRRGLIVLFLWCPPSRPLSVLGSWPLPALAAPGAASLRPSSARCVCAGASGGLRGSPPSARAAKDAARRCAAGLPASPVCRPGGPLALSRCFRPRPCEGGASSMPLSGLKVAPAPKSASY